jgi:hypothetical protein
MEVLEKVCTITELAKKLNVSTANIRMQIKNKSIPAKYFIKSEGTYIFLKSYIDYAKKRKK